MIIEAFATPLLLPEFSIWIGHARILSLSSGDVTLHYQISHLDRPGSRRKENFIGHVSLANLPIKYPSSKLSLLAYPLNLEPLLSNSPGKWID